MKKSILAIAVASLAASSAAMADPTVYGNIHLSILGFDKSDGTGAGTSGDPLMTSNTSAIGVKGSEDLGDGLKAIYKAEFQMDAATGGFTNTNTTYSYDPTDPDADVNGYVENESSTSNGNALTQRDIFAGLKGGFGTFKVGTMSSNYKQKGGKVDALYRTPAEGRGFIQTQSRLHNGRAINRGRMTSAVQYTTPKMAGFSLVANTSVSGSSDETVGFGVRYENKAILAFVDYIDAQPGGASISTNTTESAVKAGAKFSAKSFFIGGQFESAEDLTGNDYLHVNGGFLINANNIITATYGTASHVTTSTLDTTGMAVAYDHKMSKMTDVYVAYVDRSSDTASKEDSAWALGFRKKF